MFNNKIIRIETNYGYMIHGSYLSDDGECLGTTSNAVQNLIHPDFEDDKYYDVLDKLDLPIKIIAVGKFSIIDPGNLTDTIHDSTPYHFDLICLEKVR